ncbi:hypothetical protein IEQ34_022651 [Dendrobium chrysotoxum]|uniref:DUF4005 domain-containing protein n=1 Tax=Dendrobium chrysotoxum TaxID=161865 RepID=A0AAV7FYF6_DENCH|nr:hypothetical protein IEQ34_022651 [Dendrobium chrysotoxum]
MNALVRVQAQACACRALHSKTSSSSMSSHSNPQTRGTNVFDRERNQSANSNWFVKSNHSARSLATEPKSLSKDSTATLLSTPSSSSVDQHQSMSPVPQLSSGESPQYYSAASQHVNSRKGPFAPVKTERSRSFFKGYSNYPNYMANTESSMAKSRSQSAPRQRPDYEKTKA